MSEDPPDPVLELLWTRLLERWDDDEFHQRVLEHASRALHLPEIAGRYKALADDPVKGELARKRLDAVVAAASAMLASTQTPRRTRVPLPITLSGFGVCLAVLAWLAWSVWGPD